MIPYLNLKKLNTPYEAAFLEKTKAFFEKGRYILGEEVLRFEQEFADYCNTSHCIGVGNGLNQQRPLDGTDAGGADIAILQRKLRRILPDPDQHRLKVLHIQQRQPFFVGDAEGDVQHPFLHIGQPQHPRQQQRPHLGRSGAHGHALLSENVPEDRGVGLVIDLNADRSGAFLKGRVQFRIPAPGLRNPRNIALDVRQKDRDPGG